MKSIKRGRAPSLMSGVIGLVFSVIFFVMAGQVSQDFGEMAIFPALMGVAVVIISLSEIFSATRKNRYSEYDIVDGSEEPDPLNERFHGPAGDLSSESRDAAAQQGSAAAYCPYCGARVESGYAFCASCGKKLPENG